MKFNILGVIAAVALVAACASDPEMTSDTSGDGGASETAASAAPAGIAPGSEADLVVNVGARVYFDFDRFDLDDVSRATLERQAAWLAANQGVRVTVEGHCDERGTREYNLALGERRANAAKDYLVALGVSPDRVRTVSYGDERPVAMGSNETAWGQNRRGVTTVDGAGS
jgi:peptidoglycan-associated lipoprotein